MYKELFDTIVNILKEKHKGTYTYNADVDVTADGTKFLLDGKQIFVSRFNIINVSYDIKSNVLSFAVWHDDDIKVENPYLDVYIDEDYSVCYCNSAYNINDYFDDMHYFDTNALREIISQIK